MDSHQYLIVRESRISCWIQLITTTIAIATIPRNCKQRISMKSCLIRISILNLMNHIVPRATLCLGSAVQQVKTKKMMVELSIRMSKVKLKALVRCH